MHIKVPAQLLLKRAEVQERPQSTGSRQKITPSKAQD